MLVPTGAQLRAGPGHSDWLLRGPTGNAPRCASSQLLTGYSGRRVGLPVEAGGKVADYQKAGAREVGTPEKGLALPLGSGWQIPHLPQWLLVLPDTHGG